MTRNINNLDKGVRLVIALVLVVLGIMIRQEYGTVGLVVPIVIGAILVATVFMNFCPLYRIFGFSTCPDGQC